MRAPAILAALMVAAACAAASAATPDYARETRWASEVAPQIVVGDVVWLDLRGRPRVLALYAEPAGPAKAAVVVVHGLGVHPDWNLIGEVRTRLADRGYATLAVQMPVLAADAPRDAYRDVSGDAGDRLAAAVAWLRAKGHARIAIVSHSLGASMADAYLARADAAPIAAWVPIGMMAAFTRPPREPVLDVVAERDFPEALAAAKLRGPQLPRDGCSGARTIAGADHYMTGAAAPLDDAVAGFLDLVVNGRCEALAK